MSIMTAIFTEKTLTENLLINILQNMALPTTFKFYVQTVTVLKLPMGAVLSKTMY
jgi:hypothetical protein